MNLVDNMVKLGSLYHTPIRRNTLNSYMNDRLEFNKKIQEQRLLAEERREWHRLNPNQSQLQEKVQQLYQLDRLLHEESSTLQGLQRDKEEIERALSEVRYKLSKEYSDPLEVEQARKEQAYLENELSRVHCMLAENSKKLEETVAGNAKLEQELLVLKQKLQSARQQRYSPQFSNAGDSLPCAIGSSALLESDLHRVQQRVNDLQKQRKELSMQVKQLTDRSSNAHQQNLKSPSMNQNSSHKKKMISSWRETDLDTMNIIDHGDLERTVNNLNIPLYVSTDVKYEADYDYGIHGRYLESSSDDIVPNSNLVPQEKQEIKTVRIVKRESERRQRDREKTSGKFEPLFEDDDSGYVHKKGMTLSSDSLSHNSLELDKNVCEDKDKMSSSLATLRLDSNSFKSPEGSLYKSSDELSSPVFKSEAARQIINEMSSSSIQEPTPKQLNRRAVPKEKRRHHTAPNNNLIMKSLNQLPIEDDFDKMLMSRRARDDLDMERALRQKIDAPDVVRSTLSNKELKYNENTIDNILGTPNKITIPERYVPEQLPKLSVEEEEHRLRKVESIKKMLSDTTILSSSSLNLAGGK